ncbi:MAG: D-alanine--D-alanine ligase [Clostridia bacterium]|nr:D-alanine--D-alanine ligase [Clostridia bacterium]
MKISVLCGGRSTEREVSLSSGALVANALIANGGSVACVDSVSHKKAAFSNSPVPRYVIPKEPGAERFGEFLTEEALAACREADVTFIALHGGEGENGEVQRILAKEGIRFTGSDADACAVSMNKYLSKLAVREGGVTVIPGTMLRAGDVLDTRGGEYTGKPKDGFSLQAALEKAGVCEKDGVFSVEVVIKPLCGGSSVGVSIAKDTAGFIRAVIESAAYEPCFILEKRIFGREFSVGILNGEALPSIEIIPKNGFYDYECKYQPGGAVEVCPADVTEAEEKAMRTSALSAHRSLGLGVYSRIDLLLSGGVPYFLEANTLPGLTPTSLLPQEAAAVGIDYNKLCGIITGAALEKG